MKRALSSFAVVLLLAFVPRLSAQAEKQTAAPHATRADYGTKLHAPGLANAGKINEHLYRGAQPKEAGLLELKKWGITTIVDLRGEDHARIEWEKKRSEALGIRFVHIPVSGWSSPTDSQVAQFLGIFRDNPDEKVFVHCRFGEDRTGVFVAAYRMTVDKFLPDEALDEMYVFGFNGVWHPAMRSFVQKFPTLLSSAPSLSQFHDKINSQEPVPQITKPIR